MNIQSLDRNHIELFALAYSAAQDVFEVAPTAATPPKQKQIRKWVERNYVKEYGLPQKVTAFLDDANSDAEVMAFLQACFLDVQEHGTWKRQLFERATTDFSEDVKAAFLYLFESMMFSDGIECQQDVLIFSLDQTYAYTRRLVLHGVENIQSLRFDALNFDNAQIVKTEDGYRLVCEAEHYESETAFPIAVAFKRAQTVTQIFRAHQRPFYESPWDTLCWIASNIIEKGELGQTYWNEKEKRLLPLLYDMQVLSEWAPNADDRYEFTALKPYMERHGLSSLCKLLESVENLPVDSKRWVSTLRKLRGKLNESRCEPLWRELYALLADSQEMYAEVTTTCDRHVLADKRHRISTQLSALGYEGEYPNFSKTGTIKGIRLEKSYGLSYFVGMEKRVEHHIQCREDVIGGKPCIQFVCGTAFLKKHETIEDVYSCCFQAKGRRLFKTVQYDEANGTPEQFAAIAAKRAECVKLSKEEKRMVYATMPSWWQYFVLMFVVMGGLFAFAMTASLFIICCLVTVIFLGWQEIPDMIGAMPWWMLFLISFIGFGGAMTVIEYKTKTK